MGFFQDEQKPRGPVALPEDLSLTPEAPDPNGPSVLGAAFRLENPIASAMSSYSPDTSVPFDPEYRPWEDIQGTPYEEYATRFSNTRDASQVAQMKAQIDREQEDRATVQAAGFGGLAASMTAAILSPTTLLPGGAIVKGAKGVQIGRTALNVSLSAGAATALDEYALQATQQTRTGEESVVAIGGSMLLGGLLGAAVGKLGQTEFKAASAQVEQNLVVQHDLTEGLRSIGAAENRTDLTLRREGVLNAIRKVPALRQMVRTSPILRTVLSEIDETRQVAARLVESPYQYRINEEGRSTLNGDVSVETRINDRMDNDLSKSISLLERSHREYWADGPVGSVGTIANPITRRFSNIANMTEKLNKDQFMEEVGRALRSGDKHPIGQVQSAAEALRREIFDPIKAEATELGIFDPDLQIKNAESYFTRVFDQSKIAANRGNGGADDIYVPLREEFTKRQRAAQDNLAFDRTVENIEAERFQLRETVGQLERGLKKAREKADAKRGRAEGAISREGAVGRASAALRRRFQSRSDDLAARTFSDAERSALQDAVKEARGVNRLRPRDILGAIRDLGGIRDPRAGGRWTGKGWDSGANPTDIEQILDTSARTIRRKDGMELDDMREALVEAGYLDEGADINAMLDGIRSAANGEDVFSRYELSEEVARYEAAKAFSEELDALGVDKTLPLDDIIKALPDTARSETVTKAKAGEAGRSADKTGQVEGAATARLEKALDRLEDAQTRLRDLKDEIGPRVRQDIDQALKDLQALAPKLKEAQKARSADEFYADMTGDALEQALQDTVNSIIGLKPGQHSYQAALSSPTRARTLDVPDDVIAPWLEQNAEVVLNHYFRSMVPDLELTRAFGDVNMTAQIDSIKAKAGVLMDQAGSAKAKRRILKEQSENIRDLEAMRDRMRGTYGQPNDPESGWVFSGRVARTLSYTGYLGGMTLAAVPDVAGVIGRGGLKGAFGLGVDLMTNPKRLFNGVTDMTDIGSAAEWHLQTRAMSMSEVFDQYGRGSRSERALGQAAATFSKATFMTQWNVGWKSIGGAATASRMAKAAEAVRAGNATPDQLRTLSANGIETWQAQRIAEQIEQFGDKNGSTWLPRGQDWTDQEAFMAFRRAMSREFRMMVITPGQDKPLAFSNEFGKFFFQFKSFGFSAYERILLAGLQRTDADVFAQFTAAVLLGGLVSNIKADMGGYERKEGVAFWEDAVDRSGLAGWLFEPYNILSGLTGGATSISGEQVSRYQARAGLEGMLGPSVDMAQGVYEGLSATARGDATYRDARQLMRPIPGNNLFWILELSQKVEDAIADTIGADRRPD